MNKVFAPVIFLSSCFSFLYADQQSIIEQNNEQQKQLQSQNEKGEEFNLPKILFQVGCTVAITFGRPLLCSKLASKIPENSKIFSSKYVSINAQEVAKIALDATSLTAIHSYLNGKMNKNVCKVALKGTALEFFNRVTDRVLGDSLEAISKFYEMSLCMPVQLPAIKPNWKTWLIKGIIDKKIEDALS